jgi:hypothetical protein
MVGQTDGSGYLKVALGSGGTISGDQTFTGSVTIQGDLNFGDASTDDLSIIGDVSFGNASNHDITVDAAGAASNGKNLTIAAGAGTGAGNRNGGLLLLQGGAKANSGSDGYVGIGHSGGTPGDTLNDDSLYVNDKLEVDGTARLDGAVSVNNTQTNTLAAANYLKIDGATTANTGTAGILDINHSTATDTASAVDIASENTKTTGQTLYGLKVAGSSSAVVTGTNQAIYGSYATATKAGADTNANVTTVIAAYGNATNTGSTDAGTKNTYGVYGAATGDAAGTSTAYGVYGTATGADTNWAGYFNGNVYASGYTLAGDITSTATAIDWDIKDNDSSALSIDAGTVPMIELNTTNNTEQVNLLRGLNIKRFYSIVTLNVAGAETDVGLTPNGLILSACIRVSTQIDDLDNADHHIQLGLNADSDKYIDVAQGAASTSISKNKKGTYSFGAGLGLGTESSALKLTITGGGDNTPSAGAVEVEVIYLATATLADT